MADEPGLPRVADDVGGPRSTCCFLATSGRETSQATAFSTRDLDDSILDGAGPARLRPPAHVKVAIRMTSDLWLAAIVEVGELWIADRPAAMMRQQRRHRLSLVERNNDVVE